MKFSLLSHAKVLLASLLLPLCAHAQGPAYNNCGPNNCGPVCPPADCCCLNYGIGASYLYWNVQQDYLGTGAGSLVVGPNVPTIPTHKWDSGVRVNAFISNSNSPIEFDFTWTYFRTSSNQFAPDSTMNDIIGLPTFPINISSSWKIHINEFAFDIDYNFNPSPCFTVTPYIGIFAGVINQKQNMFFDLSAVPGDGITNLNIFRKNNFYGIGPRVGIDLKWNFYQQFSLVFDTNFALLIGRIHSLMDFTLPTVSPPQLTALLNHSQKIWCTRPMTSSYVGLVWECNVFCNACLSAAIGYEFQYWWNQWRASPNALDIVAVGGPRCGDLALNGLVASLGIRF